MKRWLIPAILLTIGIFVLSCSGNGNPVAPQQGVSLQAGMAGRSSDSNTHLWGLYDIYVDTINMSITPVMNRNAMFTANVTTFMNSNPLAMAFNINEIVTGSGFIDIDIDVGLVHPFPGMPQYNGYDVRGVFMGDGAKPLDYNNDLVYSIPGANQYMLPDPDTGFGGPDGYTRWFNYTEFSQAGMDLLLYTPGNLASKNFTGTATINPYKYFADGLGATEDLWVWLADHPDTSGVFSAGATNDRNYYLRFPTPSPGVVYGYAVIANWEGTDVHPSNTPEAVACSVADSSSVYYAGSTDFGGQIVLDISVWDWDSSITSGVMEDYLIYLDSDVLNNPYMFTTSDMTPIGGDENYSTYHCEIPVDMLYGIDGNEYWVIVEQDGFDYTNEFGVNNMADDDPLAAFFRYDLRVSECPDVTVTAISGMEGEVGGVEQAKQGLTYTDVTITGSGFYGTTAEVQLRNHLDPVDIVYATDVVILDLYELTCSFEIPMDQELGLYDVYVWNGCDTPKEGHADELVEVILAYDIIPWDDGPNGDYQTEMESSGWECQEILDFCVRPNDGGVYAIWVTSDPHHGSIEWYDPDLTPEGHEDDVFQPPQGAYGYSYLQFGNAFIDCNADDDIISLGLYIGPYYLYELDETLHYTNVLPNNPFPVIGWPGSVFGFVDIANSYLGDTLAYDHLVLFGYSQRYKWTIAPGENNGPGFDDPVVDDFDGWTDGKTEAIGIGNDDSAIWVIFNEEPYARRYEDLSMTAYATTAPVNFGATGTGDGELTSPGDISVRQSDNRIYIMDKPQNELRIQAFDNSDGSYIGTSGIIDLPDGVTAYRMDYNEAHGLIYVLTSDSTISIFKDTA